MANPTEMLANAKSVRITRGEIVLSLCAIQDLDDAAIAALIKDLVADYEFLKAHLESDKPWSVDDIVIELSERDERLSRVQGQVNQITAEPAPLATQESRIATDADTYLLRISYEQMQEHEQRLTRLETKFELYAKSTRPALVYGIVLGFIFTFIVIAVMLGARMLLP